MPKKPSPEEEYFARIEREQKAALQEKLRAETEAKAAEELKKLHYNCCGRCGHEMHAKIFKGVEIDVCENCGAVLLDPGELEQLVGEDRSGMIATLTELFSFSRSRADDQ